MNRKSTRWRRLVCCVIGHSWRHHSIGPTLFTPGVSREPDFITFAGTCSRCGAGESFTVPTHFTIQRPGTGSQ